MKSRITFSSSRFTLMGLAIVGSVLLAATTSVTAGAGPDRGPVLVSGLDQLPEKPPQGQTDPRYCGSAPEAGQEWERDHALASDPVNPSVLVSAWIQDFQDATTVASSTDGGRTWTRTVPVTSRCTWYIAGLAREGQPAPTYQGNDFEQTNGTNDPSIAIGVPAAAEEPGLVYLTEIVLSGSDFARSAAIVNQSADGGRTWSLPYVLEAGEVKTVDDVPTSGTVIDQTWVVADRTAPGTAYAIWTVWEIAGGVPTGTRIRYSRTEDAGVRWSTPTTAVTSPEGLYSLAGQMAQLSDGSLLIAHLTSPIQPPNNTEFPVDVMITRSPDGGKTWLPPQRLTTLTPATMVRLAAGTDGTAYVGWIRTEPDVIRPELARSDDLGATWEVLPAGPTESGAPYRATNTLVAPPAMAVAHKDTIGFAFYDHRADDPSSKLPMTTTYWLRTSRDRGTTWSTEQRVAGPFDQSGAPDHKGTLSTNRLGMEEPTYTQGMLGDTQGMATMGSAFVLTFVVSRPLSGANFSMTATDSHGNPNPTDLFSARVTP